MNPEQLKSDFDWVVSSPSLLDPAYVSENLGVELLDLIPCSIRVADGEFARLADNLRSHRVGDYFEQLSLLAVEHSPGIEVLERHLQIHSKQRTIGEIDCIYRNQQHEIVHLEVAIKFFLLSDKIPSRGIADELAHLGELNHFIGPNPADSLAGKLQHMIARQLRLSEHVSHEVDRKEILMKGVLHYPRSDARAPNHSIVAKSHLRGTWIYLKDLDELSTPDCSGTGVHYRIMKKPSWLSSHSSDADWQAFAPFADAVTKHFESGGTALLAHLRSSSAPGEPERDERCFIVNDRWPEPG